MGKHVFYLGADTSDGFKVFLARFFVLPSSVAVSIIVEPLKRRVGTLAQLGEHLLCKQGVVGSSPISSTRLMAE